MNKKDKEELIQTLSALEVVCYVLAFIYLIFNINTLTSYAQTYIDITGPITINPSDGRVTLSPTTKCFEDNGGSTNNRIFGVVNYIGLYPDTSTQINSTVSNAVCDLVMNNSSSMEGGFFIETGTNPLPNGYYWSAIYREGVANDPDETGNIQYWSATKVLGDWVAGIAPEATSTATRILNLNEPSTNPNTVTASTTVEFDVDYVSNFPVPNRICLVIDNLTTFQNLIPQCEDIFQSGILNFSTSTLLVDGNQYRWGIFIYDENNSIIDSANPFFFTVVTPPYSPYTPDESGWPFGTTPAGTSSTSTLAELTLECDGPFFSRSICNLAVLLFVPSQNSINQLLGSLDQITTKQPFSAFNEFRTGWNTATKNPTTTSTFLNLDLYGEDIEVVSTTTLNTILGDNGTTLNFLKGLVTIGLWIFLGWFLFTRVKNLF